MGRLRKMVRGLRQPLLDAFLEHAKSEYHLDVPADKARLTEAAATHRHRLEKWVEEQLSKFQRALPDSLQVEMVGQYLVDFEGAEDWRQRRKEHQQSRPAATLGEHVRRTHELHPKLLRAAHSSCHGPDRSGADKRWYYFRVRQLIAFLKQQWGQPDSVVKYPPPGGGVLAGKSGVILFEVSGWSDAAGHATLWSGTSCYDHCYFNEPGVSYTTDRANFWSLP